MTTKHVDLPGIGCTHSCIVVSICMYAMNDFHAFNPQPIPCTRSSHLHLLVYLLLAMATNTRVVKRLDHAQQLEQQRQRRSGCMVGRQSKITSKTPQYRLFRGENLLVQGVKGPERGLSVGSARSSCATSTRSDCSRRLSGTGTLLGP